MKALLKILAHSLALLFYWVISGMISSKIFNIPQVDQDNPGLILGLLWLICLLNVSVLHLYLKHSSIPKLRRAVHLFIILFGIQWLLTQIEAWFFIDPEVMSRTLISSLVVGGAIMSILYALLTYFTYPKREHTTTWVWPEKKTLIIRLFIAALLIYPLLYHNFGYFIAWQSVALREFYTGSDENLGYWTLVYQNIFERPIYLLQVFRSLLWMGLAWIMLQGFTGTRKYAMLTLGSLFAVLMNSSLLIPNPIMPDEVRLYHAIETVTSNFIWGMILILLLTRKPGAAR